MNGNNCFLSESCELVFTKLSSRTKNGKVILKNVSGHFKGRSLIAILGPSGSGKTTLLNILSGYCYQNANCNSLYINGNPTDFEQLACISSYLTQDIHLNDLLTVEENMLYAADFKLGTSKTPLEKNTIISELLNSFGLTSSRETRAGNLSGGERKRLALALEMISDPRIIYLDEPTTGLDITTTQQILSFLKKIAASGKTVICSIHQVCASHFELFDYTYVVADGHCAYQGRPQELVLFLDEHEMPCNIYHNPADYVIELCCGDFGKDKINYLVKASLNRTYGQPFSSLNDHKKKDTIKYMRYNNAGWRYKFQAMVRREFIKMYRNSFLTYLRFLGCCTLCSIIGVLFWDVGSDASRVLFNYNWVMAVASNVILSGLLCPMLIFPLEMDLIKRELHNQYYSVLQYYIAIVLLDLPVSLLTFLASGGISYYCSGQSSEPERIALYLLFTVLLGNVVNAVGFFFGTLVTSIRTAITLCSLTQVPLLAISGYVIMFQDLPWIIERASLFGYTRTGLQGSLIAVFGLSPRRLPCPEDENYCFYKDTHKLLHEFGIDPYDFYWSLYVLIAWLIFVRVGTYFTMRYRLSQ